MRKGFDLLLECWRTTPPDATLLLVGDDERITRVRREVESGAFRGRVRVLGPRSDVEMILAVADVLCLPSRQERFGNVVLEAAAAGVPVVTNPVVGAAELLRDSSAAMVVPTDAGTLRGAITEVLGTAWAERKAARRLAERFPWSRHLDAVEGLFAEVSRHG